MVTGITANLTELFPDARNMDNNNSSSYSPFYNHTNNSAASTNLTFTNNDSSNNINNIRGGNGNNNTSSQVSSVGFNNLKKQSTNSSQSSSISTATIKTNPLVRLFTKNKSSSTVISQQQQQPIFFKEDGFYSHGNGSQELSLDDDVDFNDQYTNEISNNDSKIDKTKLSSYGDARKSSSPNLFKLSKKHMGKNKIRFSNKAGNTKPDLSIQTNGHHGLKVPKKILNNAQNEDFALSKIPTNRKNSVSSPVSTTFHNLFHRNHSQVPDSSQTSNVSKDDIILASFQPINSNPNRTAISLSSNSSNSFISDISFAMIYNFTDPDYSIEDYESSGEHTSFLDIHKKLMIPTDQYLQHKLHKHQTSELGLGIMSDEGGNNDEYLNKYLIDFGKRNAKFFSSLLSISKPLFTPSQQKRLNNGKMHPNLCMSIEDVSNFIKDNYMSDNSIIANNPSTALLLPLDNGNKSPGKRDKFKKLSTSKLYNEHSTSTLSLGEAFNDDNLDDFKAREISQDLLTYFYRCMIMFQKDYPNYFHTKVIPTMKRTSVVSTNSTNTNIDDHRFPQLKQLEKDWTFFSSQWSYFNTKIRFSVVNMFFPLQNYFHTVSMQRFSSDPKNMFEIEIENILLVAFRDIVMIPILMKRKHIYQELIGQQIPLTQQSLSSTYSPASQQHLIHQQSSASSISFSPYDQSYNKLQRTPNNNRHHASSYTNQDVERMKIKEESILKKDDGKLLKSLVNCFGIILSHTHNESGNADGEQYIRDTLFDEASHWLTNIN